MGEGEGELIITIHFLRDNCGAQGIILENNKQPTATTDNKESPTARVYMYMLSELPLSFWETLVTKFK